MLKLLQVNKQIRTEHLNRWPYGIRKKQKINVDVCILFVGEINIVNT